MLFGQKKHHFLGIDFGTSLIKIVELTVENGELRLSNFGQADLALLEAGKLTKGTDHDQEVLLYLSALLARFDPKSDSAYVAMPAFIGLISLIELPEMSEEELKEAIRFEAHKYIPSPLEEIALSFEVTDVIEGENKQKKMEILLVAALKKEVERYRKLVSDAKLHMAFLELETFSLARSIIGHREGLFLLIDIGSRATNLVLVDDGTVKMSRNLDVGGKDITRTLHEGLNLTFERAEGLKKSKEDFLNTRESSLIFPSLELIASEGERMIDSFGDKYKEAVCQGAVLSGGSAQMTGLTEYFARMLKLSVTVGNPWERISYDSSRKSDIEKLGTSFSVAIGLALAGVDAIAPKRESLTKKSFSFKELLSKKL